MSNAADSDFIFSLSHHEAGLEVQSALPPVIQDFDFTTSCSQVANSTQLLKSVMDESISEQEVFSWVQEQHRQNPFFLLNECASESCGLTRAPDEKNSFRDQIAHAMVAAILPPLFEIIGDGIDIGIFGSGGLLYEAQILSLLLKANIHIRSIHLIDTKYRDLTLHPSLSPPTKQELLTCANSPLIPTRSMAYAIKRLRLYC